MSLHICLTGFWSMCLSYVCVVSHPKQLKWWPALLFYWWLQFSIIWCRKCHNFCFLVKKLSRNLWTWSLSKKYNFLCAFLFWNSFTRKCPAWLDSIGCSIQIFHTRIYSNCIFKMFCIRCFISLPYYRYILFFLWKYIHVTVGNNYIYITIW